MAQQVSDPRIADLARSGKIRVGVHSFMYTNDPETGELKGALSGVALLDIARALAAKIGIDVAPVGHPTIPGMLTCITSGACDFGFMGPDPSRTGVDFSPPILQLDYTFLVPAGSSIERIGDADRLGVRIAVVRDHASTLALSRIIKYAELVFAATPEPTFELLRTGKADALASTRGVLLAYSPKLPNSRVLEDHYATAGAEWQFCTVAMAGSLVAGATIWPMHPSRKRLCFVESAKREKSERGWVETTTS